MGICMTARTLSDQKIEAIMADPPLVWRIVAPDNPQLYLEEAGQGEPPGWFERLLGAKRAWPPAIPSFDFAEGETLEVDVDKSWDGINFCLQRIIETEECPNLFEDGEVVGDVEIGYGPAMCFNGAQVARLAACYAAVTADQLLAQYAPADMEGVYPSGLWDGADDSRDYLVDNFLELQAFLARAREHGLGILIQYT